MGAGVADDELVAVGRRLGDAQRAGGPARAGNILDDDLLAEELAHGRRQDATDHVDRTAGRKRHYHGERTRGPFLRLGGTGRRKHQRGDDEPPQHRSPPSSRTPYASICAHQSALAPLALIGPAQRSISLGTNFARYSGVLRSGAGIVTPMPL
jgi:hypothetical protein